MIRPACRRARRQRQKRFFQPRAGHLEARQSGIAQQQLSDDVLGVAGQDLGRGAVAPDAGDAVEGFDRRGRAAT